MTLLIIVLITMALICGHVATSNSNIEDETTLSPNIIDMLTFGLRLYALDENQPTCVGQGFIYDTSERDVVPSETFKSYNNWAENMIAQHNEERTNFGYNSIRLSQNLSKISFGYAKLFGIPKVSSSSINGLELTPHFENRSSHLQYDILFEETYYNEQLKFQAPDVNVYSTRACCPAPFMRFLSKETKEVGISRIVYETMGNFKRMIVLATFYPKSSSWIATGLCKTDKTVFGNAMYDSSEYDNGEYDYFYSQEEASKEMDTGDTYSALIHDLESLENLSD